MDTPSPESVHEQIRRLVRSLPEDQRQIAVIRAANAAEMFIAYQCRQSMTFPVTSPALYPAGMEPDKDGYLSPQAWSAMFESVPANDYDCAVDDWISYTDNLAEWGASLVDRWVEWQRPRGR